MGLLRYLPVQRGALTFMVQLKGADTSHPPRIVSPTQIFTSFVYIRSCFTKLISCSTTAPWQLHSAHTFIWQETWPQWDCQSCDHGKGVQGWFESRERVCTSFGGVQWFSYAGMSEFFIVKTSVASEVLVLRTWFDLFCFVAKVWWSVKQLILCNYSSWLSCAIIRVSTWW
jgi:hypothetical protein